MLLLALELSSLAAFVGLCALAYFSARRFLLSRSLRRVFYLMFVALTLGSLMLVCMGLLYDTVNDLTPGVIAYAAVQSSWLIVRRLTRKSPYPHGNLNSPAFYVRGRNARDYPEYVRQPHDIGFG